VQTFGTRLALEIRGKTRAICYVRRQSTIKCRLERRGRKWRIVSLEPAGSFAPPEWIG